MSTSLSLRKTCCFISNAGRGLINGILVDGLWFHKNRTMAKDHKEILLQGNAAISAGDHEGFLSLCTEDTRWEFMGDQILQGKQAVRDYMRYAYTEPPVFSVEQMISEGDWLTVLGEITLTDKDGKATRYSYCDVWRFEEGKMAELKAFVVAI
jgi:uncharacterized protein